jgi:hypothetical protein
MAGALIRQTGFAYLRVDRIEQAIIGSAALRPPLGPVGYTVAYEVAAEPGAPSAAWPSSLTVSTYRLRSPDSLAGGSLSGLTASGPAMPSTGGRPWRSLLSN